MPKVSEEHRASQRAEILDAARRCFASNGFHATSMQDILCEAGKSAGAVYRYFPGKADIVTAIAQQNSGTLLDALALTAEQTPQMTVADVLVTVLDTIRRKHEAHGTALVAVQVWAESAREPQLREQFAATHERLRALVAGMITRRNPDAADRADAMAGVVSALVPGFLLQLAQLDAQRTAQFEQSVRAVLGDL